MGDRRPGVPTQAVESFRLGSRTSAPSQSPHRALPMLGHGRRRKFKAGAADVLVATDVAAKGLDFPDIQHVINFDMPKEVGGGGGGGGGVGW